jgi:hypothetical protein
MDVYMAAPPFARTLYANGILLAMLGIPLVLAGALAGFAVDFWWLFWIGLGIFGFGAFLWLVGSTAIAPVYGSLVMTLAIVLALIGLVLALTSGFWWVLWLGIGMLVAEVCATLCVAFLVTLDHRTRLE